MARPIQSPVAAERRGPRQWTRQAPQSIALGLFCAALVVAVWWGTFNLIASEHTDAINDEIRGNENLVMALEEQTIRTLRNVEQSIRFVASEFAQRGLALNLRKMIQDGNIDGSIFTNIAVVDEHGDIILNNIEFPPTNVADREYFQALRQHADTGMFIGKPLLGRVSKRWTVHLARRVNKPDGSFGGVVYAGLDPDFFTSLYKQTDLGKQGAVALVGLDGIARASWIGGVSNFGQDLRQSILFDQQRKNRTGSFLAVDNQDGVRRFVSYRTLTDYPLIVLVGTSETEGLASYYDLEHQQYLSALLATTGIVLFALGLMASFSRQQRAFDSLAGSEAQLQATFDQAAIGIARIALDGRFLQVNPKLCSLLGYTPQELLSRTVAEVMHPDDLASSAAGIASLLGADTGTSAGPEKRFVRKDGSVAWVGIASAEVHDPDGRTDYLITMVQDIGDRKELQDQLVYQAHYDSLTKLPNRTLCHDRLQLAINQALRRSWNVAVLLVDLDRFKVVNETLGHGAGDKLLQEVAERMAKCVRAEDTVGRLDSDEFLIIVS